MAVAQSVYWNTYTLISYEDIDSRHRSGWRPLGFCGVYVRVPAHANGNADPTLCDGAPTYKMIDRDYVLLRQFGSGGTWWGTADSTALGSCDCSSDSNGNYDQPPQCLPRDRPLRSDSKPGPQGLDPSARDYLMVYNDGGDIKYICVIPGAWSGQAEQLLLEDLSWWCL